MKKTLIGQKHFSGPAFDSILLALIQIVTYAANLVTTKILSVELSLTEYGTYSTVNSIITIAASLTLFGLGDSLNYYYNKQRKERAETDREEYVNTIFFVQLIVGVFVGIVLLCFSGAISNYYNNALVQPLIWIICLKPWISNATHLYQVLFVSTGKAKLIAIRNFIISLLKVVLLAVSVVVFKSLSAVFICLVLLDLAQLIAFKYIFGKIKFKVNVFAFQKDKFVPVIQYTVPMGIYFVTTTLMREIDKLVVGRMGTTEELAIYSNCAKTLPINLLVTSFATVLIPYIMKNVTAGNYRLTSELLRKYLSVGYLSVWMFSGALLLCAPETIQFFYSEEYIVGTPIFIFYILDGMIQFASMHLVIAANGNSKFLMTSSLSLLLLNTVLSPVFYKLLDIWNFALLGPAIATVLVSAIYVCILHAKTAKILEEKVTAFLPLKPMLLYLCEIGLIAIPFYFIKRGMAWLNLPWVAILIVVCAGYCLTVAALNIKQYKTLFAEINAFKDSNNKEVQK